MNENNRNMIIAIALSLVVLFGWQYFVAGPQLERAQRQAEIAAQQKAGDTSLATPAATGTGEQPATGQAAPGTAPATTAPGTQTFADKAAALAASPRVTIDTPALAGSINLKGARLDDIELKDYRETVDPKSPIISLLSPAGAPDAYFVEQGWAQSPGGDVKLPDSNTVWSVDGNSTLTPDAPVTLSWNNGEGLTFKRTISVDKDYLFTVEQSIENASSAPVSVFPYARVSRYGTPKVSNYYLVHEGPLGLLGDNNLVSLKYSDLQKESQKDVTSTRGGWIGFTDKYWAATVIPQPDTPINARFSWSKPGATDVYLTSYVEQKPVVVQPGATGTDTSYVFAGAKVESVLTHIADTYHFDRFDLLIDWGWFAFITHPMFVVITFLHGLLGNFGLAILAVTLIVKGIFFPLANRSYASMAAMRRVQPEMKAIQERFKDDRAQQQQAVMELYKREKINPVSGCWPLLIQIPVFYSLYTVLFVTIEMRHAPFFGWIQDLAAPDPTHVFNLFGLLPYDPSAVPVIGHFLAIGVWPLIMGVTMWVQMKLNPPPTDPSQAMIFGLMPVVFTFMLAGFPAGLVIYWAWNNTLSVTQQYIIMKRHGVEVNLLGNIVNSFRRKPAADKSGS
ncbi:MAG TPA: membrane protein insertase YidC [Devosiaceae bacterium]